MKRAPSSHPIRHRIIRLCIFFTWVSTEEEMTVFEPKLESFCDLRTFVSGTDLYDSTLPQGPPAEPILALASQSHVPALVYPTN